MFRVFDSKAETEESDSEEERIFEMGGSFTGAAAARVGFLACICMMLPKLCQQFVFTLGPIV